MREPLTRTLELASFLAARGWVCVPPSRGRTLSWPPTSHTVKLMFLYSTVSTLKPALEAVGRRQARGSRSTRGRRARRLGPIATLWGRRTDSGDGRHDLAELELVQDRRLTGGVQSHLCEQREEQQRALSGACLAQPPLAKVLCARAWCCRPPGCLPLALTPRTIRMRISFFAISRASSREMARPMAACVLLSLFLPAAARGGGKKGWLGWCERSEMRRQRFSRSSCDAR